MEQDVSVTKNTFPKYKNVHFSITLQRYSFKSFHTYKWNNVPVGGVQQNETFLDYQIYSSNFLGFLSTSKSQFVAKSKLGIVVNVYKFSGTHFIF